MDDSVTNLEEVLKQWAWKHFHQTNKSKPTLTFDTAQIDVIWDKVKVVTERYSFSKKKLSPNVQMQIVFSSTFDNETDRVQRHNFQTSRSTTAVASIQLNKGFISGLNAGVKLPVPNDVLKATAVFGTSLTIGSEEQNVLERALTWTVNTTVTAPQGQRTLADLEIVEQQLKCRFEMDVRLKGRVVVRISDPISGQMLMVVQNQITTILDDMIASKRGENGGNTKSGTFKFKGTALFQYGVSQRIRVYQENLDNEEDDEEEEDEDEYEYE